MCCIFISLYFFGLQLLYAVQDYRPAEGKASGASLVTQGRPKSPSSNSRIDSKHDYIVFCAFFFSVATLHKTTSRPNVKKASGANLVAQ